LAQDNHKNTTANGVGSLGSGQCCGVFVIVLSQDFQHHSLWCFCDCPEPRLPTPFVVDFCDCPEPRLPTPFAVDFLRLSWANYMCNTKRYRKLSINVRD
jgi:hypothetical protein